MPSTTPLNVLDELYLHLDRPDEAWSVHLEVELEGRMDGRRLATAVESAAGAHPIARASLRSARATDVHYHWEIVDRLARVPLEEADCDDDAAVDALRERLMAASPDLDEAPPFELALAHRPGGDVLLLNLHHAAGDGMSALRLMASILRAYGGQDDPAAPVDPLAVRDVGRLVGSRSIGTRLGRTRALLGEAARAASGPARIAPDGARSRPGYGFRRLAVAGPELETVMALRRDGATVNDVLLGALAVAVHRWNEMHGEPAGGRVALTMPINLRPPEWRFEVLGNFASYVSVPVALEHPDDLGAAVAAAAQRTRAIKDRDAAGLMVDLLQVPTATLPTGVKRRFQDLIPLTGDRWVDTAVLSNLGRLEPLEPLDDDAGSVRRLWFSPPGRMPLGASFGAATYGDELLLTLRYRHALLDADAAERFIRSLHEILIEPDNGATP